MVDNADHNMLMMMAVVVVVVVEFLEHQKQNFRKFSPEYIIKYSKSYIGCSENAKKVHH